MIKTNKKMEVHMKKQSIFVLVSMIFVFITFLKKFSFLNVISMTILIFIFILTFSIDFSNNKNKGLSKGIIALTLEFMYICAATCFFGEVRSIPLFLLISLPLIIGLFFIAKFSLESLKENMKNMKR